MELNCTAEKSEKETVRLFLRRRGFLRDLRQCVAIMSVLCLAVSIFYWFGSAGFSCGLCQGLMIALPGTGIFLFGFFILDRIIIQTPRRAYRQRKTHKVEYRLTDDALAFTVGETQFSSPWNKVAKKFRIDKKALYLYGKDLPFEAKCIPDWQGHGVERKELVAALKKAGLKKAMSGRLKFLIWLVASPVVLAALLTVYFYIGGIEWGDWTIPNEAELRLELHDVPDEENAYLALQALTNLYHVADCDGDTNEICDKRFVGLYNGSFFSEGDDGSLAEWTAMRNDPSSPKRAARILADNAEFFKALHAALSLRGYAEIDKRLEDAKRKREGGWPWISYLPLYRPFINFAQLVAFRAQVALEQGDVEAAVSDIGEIHALGQLVMSNNESLVGYLVGKLIDESSFRKMCDVVAMGKATDEIIERFNKLVAVSEANASTAWKRALKAESAMHFEGLEWMFNHLAYVLGAFWFHNYDNSLMGRMLSVWPGFAKFACHRREMQYRQAMIGRVMLAGDDDLMEMILEEIPRNPLLPNGIGNSMGNNTAKLCPFLSSYAKSGRLNRLRPRLVLASEKWRRAHGGENPPTLEALVPDYLAAVPRDPWSKSGESMKYDAALGVVWSIGKDGKYDYREIAKDLSATGNKASINGDTQKYAFRLDGKPIGFPIKAGHR